MVTERYYSHNRMAIPVIKEDIMDDILTRLESHSVRGERADQCIIWTGAKAGHSGYGNMRNPIRIVFPDQPLFVRVHRLAYALYHDMYTHEIPLTNVLNEKLDVSHLCHNKLCIHIDHLILETHTSNMSRETCTLLGHFTRDHLVDKYCVFKGAQTIA